MTGPSEFGTKRQSKHNHPESCEYQAARPAPPSRPPSQRGSLTGASEPSPLPETGCLRERTTGAEPGDAGSQAAFAPGVGAEGGAPASRGHRLEKRRAALSRPFCRGERRKPRLRRTSSLACHLELCFKVASGRLLSAALSEAEPERRGWGGVRGLGAQWVPEGGPPHVRVRAHSRGGARGVRAGPRAPGGEACPLAACCVLEGPRLHASRVEQL